MTTGERFAFSCEYRMFNWTTLFVCYETRVRCILWPSLVFCRELLDSVCYRAVFSIFKSDSSDCLQLAMLLCREVLSTLGDAIWTRGVSSYQVSRRLLMLMLYTSASMLSRLYSDRCSSMLILRFLPLVQCDLVLCAEFAVQYFIP